MLHPLMCYNLPQLFLRSLFDHLWPALLVLYCHLEGGQNKTLAFLIDFSQVLCPFFIINDIVLCFKVKVCKLNWKFTGCFLQGHVFLLILSVFQYSVSFIWLTHSLPLKMLFYRVYVFTGQRETDVYQGICWETVTESLTCTKPIASLPTTFTECCCLYGDAWGMDCALCPLKNTGINTQLHREKSGAALFFWSSFANMIPQDMCSFLKLLQTQRNCKHKKQRKQIKTKLVFIPIQRPMPLCVISVSMVIPVGRMVRMHWLLAQSLNTALNTTLDLWTPTALCPCMKIMKDQEVSTNILLKEIVGIIDWLIDWVSWFTQIHIFWTCLSDPYDAFEGLRAEECGVLNGCENGRCVRVQEGYTCDCFDGYTLDMSRMACVGEQQHMITCVTWWGDQHVGGISYVYISVSFY